MVKKNRFLYPFIHKYPFAFCAIISSGFMNSCISFLLTLSIGKFFSIQFNTGSSKAKLLTHLGLHLYTIEGFFLLFIILLTAKALVTYFESYGTFKQGELFVKNLREQIFASQMQWESSSFSKGAYGKFLLRYSNDMKAVQHYYTKGIIGGIKNLLFVSTGLLVLSRIHLMLTILIFLLLIFVVVAVTLLSAYQKKFISAARTNRSSLLAFVAKSFAGFQKIKQNFSESEKIQNYNRRSDSLYNSNMRSNQIESLLQSSTSFLYFVIICIILWQMTRSYIHISATDGLTVILIMLMMQGTIKQILKVPGYINKGKISLQKIDDLLQKEYKEYVYVESRPATLLQ